MARLLRVPILPLEEGEMVLGDAPSRYVTRVHRLRAGDAFVAFDPETRTEADVEIVSVARAVRCRVGPVRPSEAVARTRLTLLQAIGKGDKPEQVIRDATALGVTRIVFVESARAVPRPGDRGATRRKRWHAVAVESARQCGRGDVPAVDGPTSLGQALGDLAPGGLRLCLAPEASQSIGAALEGAGSAEVVLLVGPEGGFEESEIGAALAAGFTPVSLFEFVLRTETAAVAALGAVLGILRA